MYIRTIEILLSELAKSATQSCDNRIQVRFGIYEWLFPLKLQDNRLMFNNKKHQIIILIRKAETLHNVNAQNKPCMARARKKTKFRCHRSQNSANLCSVSCSFCSKLSSWSLVIAIFTHYSCNCVQLSDSWSHSAHTQLIEFSTLISIRFDAIRMPMPMQSHAQLMLTCILRWRCNFRFGEIRSLRIFCSISPYSRGIFILNPDRKSFPIHAFIADTWCFSTRSHFHHLAIRRSLVLWLNLIVFA